MRDSDVLKRRVAGSGNEHGLDEGHETFSAAIAPAVLADFSLVTGAGLSAEKTSVAINAGIDVYHQDIFIGANERCLTTAFLPEGILPALHPALESARHLPTRTQRMLQLLTAPFLALINRVEDDKNIVLFLSLPELLPCMKKSVADEFLRLLAQQCEVDIDLRLSAVNCLGRAGGIDALQQAMQFLTEHSSDNAVIVGGVDSYRDLALLSGLDRESRLLSVGAMDGFVPGEAAAFIRLNAFNHGEAMEGGVVIFPPGLAQEAGHRYEPSEVYTGDGLANAARLALASSPESCIENIYSTLNGESLSAKEWGVCALRNSEALGDNWIMHHPAEFYGDIGAASAPVMLAMAAINIRKKNSSNATLLWCCSDLGARAAVVLAGVSEN